MSEKEKWTLSESGDAIIAEGPEWDLVACVYGYGGKSESDAPGVAERAALIIAAPGLQSRAEAAEAERDELRAQLEQDQINIAAYQSEHAQLALNLEQAQVENKRLSDMLDADYRTSEDLP